MILDITLTLSNANDFLSFLKNSSPFILLFLGFILSNWWNTKEKHNDELKSIDEKTIYFISMIRISINELLELKSYYEKTILELENKKYILPSRTSNSFYMMNKILQINNVEIYFKIFNKYKGQNNIEQFNEMMKFYDETLTDYKLIFNTLFAEYQKKQNEDDAITLEYYMDLMQSFTISSKENFKDLDYIDILKKGSGIPFDLKFFYENIFALIQKGLVKNKKYDSIEDFELISKCSSVRTIYNYRTENYKILFKDLPDFIKLISEKEKIFKLLLKEIETNYDKSAKPFHGGEFKEKVEHYLNLDK